MSRPFAFPLSFLAGLVLGLLLLVAPAAKAQWLVYETTFTTDQENSINFSHYTGAYFVAPIHGGKASIIFVTAEGGHFYAVSENCARFFIPANSKVRHAAFSANTHAGTAEAMYQATGPLNSSMTYSVAGQQRAEAIATTLTGTLLASDDESTVNTPATDGSLGMVGSAVITAQIRSDLSATLNKHAKSMTDGVDLVVGLLEQIGYVPDDGSAEPAEELPVASVTAVQQTLAETAQPVQSADPNPVPTPVKTRTGQRLTLPVTVGTSSYAHAPAKATTSSSPSFAGTSMSADAAYSYGTGRTPNVSDALRSPAFGGAEDIQAGSDTFDDGSNIDSRLFPQGSQKQMEQEAAQQVPQYHPYPAK